MNSSGFSVGRLSGETGVNIETIRYCERIGLMAKTARTEGGRRVYDRAASRRLSFIRRARELGFSIEDMGAACCVSGRWRVLRRARPHIRHLDDVRAKIADLKRQERTLTTTAKRCARNASPDCPIIDALSAPRRRS